jgi:hypothetical protein
MKSAPENSALEQREYFRIDDTAIVQYRIISEDEYQQLAVIGNDILDKLTLKAKFDYMSRQLQPLHRTITSSHPDIAQFLSILDQKLNMLTEQMVKDEISEVDHRPQVVNIGAGGMSFSAESPLMTGALLEIRLVLLPEMTGVSTYANVVSCVRKNAADSAEAEYQVAVHFENMSDEVRDIISRHVLTKEQSMLRKQKQD